MKPQQARELRKRVERAEEIRGEKLQAYLTADEPVDEPKPELVPTAEDKTATLREYRRLVRLAAGEMRGSEKHGYYLDRAIVMLARLVFIERALALADEDPVAHMALTAGDLVRLSIVDPEEIARRFRALQEGVTS